MDFDCCTILRYADWDAPAAEYVLNPLTYCAWCRPGEGSRIKFANPKINADAICHRTREDRGLARTQYMVCCEWTPSTTVMRLYRRSPSGGLRKGGKGERRREAVVDGAGHKVRKMRRSVRMHLRPSLILVGWLVDRPLDCAVASSSP